jgi:DNA polymerase-3 subunit beta
MKATVLQENLLPKVTTVARVASARSALPVLENILLSCEKGKLTLAATDLETGIKTSVGAKVQESGSLTVPARLLAGLIGNLPSGKVTLKAEKEVLKIEAEGVSSRINGLSSEEFPTFSVEGKSLLSIEGKKLKKAIDQVSFAAAQDEARPILTGVLFQLGKEGLTLTGVDGFRLAEKRLKIPSSGKASATEEFSLVVPARGLGEASRLISSGEVEILTSEETQLLFAAKEFSVFTQSLEGEFPDYEQIIPVNPATTLEFDKEELAKAVQLTSVFSDKGMNVIKLSFDPAKKKMEVSSQEAESGEVSIAVGIKGEGKRDKIAFNSRYLADALAAFDSQKVLISLSSGLDPALFKGPGDPSYLHVIMPVRVQD